ncbi:hypothetical protein CF65_00771 [Aggregatibacter actinomycetemcomitans HK1651]|nr:hypothetical protein CF65_00771 [Aggregatibacter actinomycetemcomitans HK1651]
MIEITYCITHKVVYFTALNKHIFIRDKRYNNF